VGAERKRRASSGSASGSASIGGGGASTSSSASPARTCGGPRARLRVRCAASRERARGGDKLGARRLRRLGDGAAVDGERAVADGGRHARARRARRQRQRDVRVQPRRLAAAQLQRHAQRETLSDMLGQRGAAQEAARAAESQARSARRRACTPCASTAAAPSAGGSAAAADAARVALAAARLRPAAAAAHTRATHGTRSCIIARRCACSAGCRRGRKHATNTEAQAAQPARHVHQCGCLRTSLRSASVQAVKRRERGGR
jgi:hypothetical protein